MNGLGAQHREVDGVGEHLTDAGWLPETSEVVAAGLALTLSHESKVALTERWLASKGIVLWMNWDVTNPMRRAEAAEYIVKVYDDLGAVFRKACRDR